MNGSASSSPADILHNLELRSAPYPFFVSTEAFEPALAANLLQWLESGVAWRLHCGGFYEQWECDLLQAAPPPSCAPLFSQEALSDVRHRMANVFGTPLSERMTVIAHKLVRGQAIGVHNDDPDPGYETHRLVVQLNRRTDSDVGGELLVHGSNQPGDVVLTVAPVHNTAFGFAMSSRSFHSVAPMQDWARYTIVFSFWTTEADAEASRLEREKVHSETGATAMAARLPDDERGRLARLTTVLQTLGASAQEHSDDNLLAHLVHTYLLLRSWGCAVDLATAGLFHSVYGTHDFHPATVQLEDRPLLQQLIGERAEAVAYLYGACSKQSLHACLASGPPYKVHDLRNDSSIALSDGLFHDLVLLDLANEIEQQPRVQEDADALRERRSLFERAAGFMPEGALAALRRTYP